MKHKRMVSNSVIGNLYIFDNTNAPEWITIEGILAVYQMKKIDNEWQANAKAIVAYMSKPIMIIDKIHTYKLFYIALYEDIYIAIPADWIGGTTTRIYKKLERENG